MADAVDSDSTTDASANAGDESHVAGAAADSASSTSASDNAEINADQGTTANTENSAVSGDTSNTDSASNTGASSGTDKSDVIVLETSAASTETEKPPAQRRIPPAAQSQVRMPMFRAAHLPALPVSASRRAVQAQDPQHWAKVQ